MNMKSICLQSGDSVMNKQFRKTTYKNKIKYAFVFN